MNRKDYNDLSFSDKAAKLVADIARAYLRFYRGVKNGFTTIKEKFSALFSKGNGSKNSYKTMHSNKKTRKGKNNYNAMYVSSNKKNRKKGKNADYKGSKAANNRSQKDKGLHLKEKIVGAGFANIKWKVKAPDMSEFKGKMGAGYNSVKELVLEKKVYFGAGFGLVLILIAALIIVPPMMGEKTNRVAAQKVDLSEITITEAKGSEAMSASVGVAFEGELLDSQTILDMGVDVYSLMVNNQEVAVFKTVDQANEVLAQLKTSFIDDTSDQEVGETAEAVKVEYKKVFFKEDIEVVENKKRVADFEGFRENEMVLDYIIKGTDEVRTHQVQKGENYWVIAKDYGVNVSDLEKANPDVKPERLQINQIISLIVPKPMITVVAVRESQYIEDIKYEVEYEDSGKIYKGEYSVKKNGQVGERDVVAEVYTENGREVGRNIVSEDIIKEPVTKIVYKGTKNPPPKIGTGKFMKPLSRGWVSSPFGVWRGDHRHSGIDIAVPTGTSVKAADGGVVTFSGTNGSYGKCVIINHGGFMTTLYAHNSKLLVKKGDKVFKGQKVALSGSTGRSTGPHLHFEIRKNKIPINPTKYVKF